MSQTPHDDRDAGRRDATAPRSLLGRLLTGIGLQRRRVGWDVGPTPLAIPIPEDGRHHGGEDGWSASDRHVDSLLLAAAVADMRQLEATVFHLRHERGLSFEAIGRRLRLEPRIVRAHWVRGLKRLRRSYALAPGASVWESLADRESASDASAGPSLGPDVPDHGSR
jgi:DNA-directed RNA polymerase specialized sigma24 family protein